MDQTTKTDTTMTTAKNIIEVVKRVRKLNNVRDAWSPDRGYIIVGFDNNEAMSRVIEIMEENNYRVFDIHPDWLVDGKECHALHFAHHDRDDLIENRI